MTWAERIAAPFWCLTGWFFRRAPVEPLEVIKIERVEVLPERLVDKMDQLERDNRKLRRERGMFSNYMMPGMRDAFQNDFEAREESLKQQQFQADMLNREMARQQNMLMNSPMMFISTSNQQDMNKATGVSALGGFGGLFK